VRACGRARVCVGGGREGGASVSSKHEGLRVLTATNLHKLGLQREAFFALVAIDAFYNNEFIFFCFPPDLLGQVWRVAKIFS